MKAARGNVVSLSYSLTDDDGIVLDSTEGREPLSYLHGYGNIIPGLERELEGREGGYASQVTVEPEEAYGQPEPKAVFDVPMSDLPADMEFSEGMEVVGETPQGPVRLTVTAVGEDSVTLDGNHPLAGKTLHFEVEVLSVREGTPEEKAQGHPTPSVEIE
jgi:FKBP-type peptidyl-prolyl cis-trans isomerase SlyD